MLSPEYLSAVAEGGEEIAELLHNGGMIYGEQEDT